VEDGVPARLESPDVHTISIDALPDS
jgi:hypothetical protein